MSLESIGEGQDPPAYGSLEWHALLRLLVDSLTPTADQTMRELAAFEEGFRFGLSVGFDRGQRAAESAVDEAWSATVHGLADRPSFDALQRRRYGGAA